MRSPHIPRSCQHRLPGWTHWLLSQSLPSVLACTLTDIAAAAGTWQRLWQRVAAHPSNTPAIQRALLQTSNTAVADEGNGQQGPVFIAGPSAGARLLQHTLPLALLAPGPTLEHVVRSAMADGHHGRLVGPLLGDLRGVWAALGVGQEGEAAPVVLEAVAHAVLGCVMDGRLHDAQQHAIETLLQACMQVRMLHVSLCVSSQR